MDMHRIKNVSFIGMAGCGKSTIGKALSENLGINFTDTDLLIEERFKASLEQIKKDNGYKFVRYAEEEVILSLDKHIKIISTGGSAVYSEKSMSHLSSFSKIVYINTSLDEIKKRIGQGQRCGYLPFGGVVDLFLPVESKVLVEVGQRVDSGSTVLAELIHSEPLSSVNV